MSLFKNNKKLILIGNLMNKKLAQSAVIIEISLVIRQSLSIVLFGAPVPWLFSNITIPSGSSGYLLQAYLFLTFV